jgi:hypothetical protein
MVRPLVALLATAFLAACTSTAGSPSPSASPTEAAASTPRVADGPGASSTLPPSDASCTFSRTGSDVRGGVFVAVADNGAGGVAFVLDAESGAERGRLQIAGAPEVAVDWVGRRFLAFCGSRLVAYDLATFAEEWSVPGLDRLITKAPGGLPALAVSDDGTLSFELHYRTLRPGDANAPGASRTWLVARDPSTGVPKGDVDLGDCGAGRVLAGADVAYVVCRDGLHVIDTASWTDRSTYAFTASVRPAAVLSGKLYGVTRELTIVSLDLTTGATTEFRKDDPSGAAQTWGRLAIAGHGQMVWVVAKRSGDLSEFAPDTLTVLGLGPSDRSDIPIAGLRGVGLVGAHVIYGANGRLRSIDGAFDLPLVAESPEYWHIFGAPSAGN